MYNEEANIASTINELSEYLKAKDFSSEVILIDDGSKDNTVERAKESKSELKNLRVIESFPNGGKGYVIKKAVLEARGDNIMFMDADSSVSIKELDKFIPLLKDEEEIYVASRRIPGAEVTIPVIREILGRIYILISKLLLGIRVNDINCGFKIFKHEAAKKVFYRQIMNDWSFDAELLFLSGKYGYGIKEIPIKWEYKDTSKVRPLKDGVGSFMSLIKIRLNDLFGKYKEV